MNAAGRERGLTVRLVWAGLGTLIAVLAAMAWVDIPLAVFLHRFEGAAWVAFFAVITNFANGVIWFSIAAVALAAAWLQRRLAPARMTPARLTQHLRAWLFMAAAMATSGIAINIVKAVVGRERPRVLFRDGTADFQPFTYGAEVSSFPSGHTQSICSAMLALWFIYPPLRPLYVVVALLVSGSRVIITSHYLSDVIGGAFMAMVAVLLWRAWFERAGLSVTLATAPRPGPASAPPPRPTSS